MTRKRNTVLAGIAVLAAAATIDALISPSCLIWSSVSASIRTARTWSTWPGAAAASAAHPSSVSCAM